MYEPGVLVKDSTHVTFDGEGGEGGI